MRAKQAHHHLHQSGFARTVGPNERDLFSLMDMQIEPVENYSGLSLYRTVRKGHILKRHDSRRCDAVFFRRRFGRMIHQGGEKGLSFLNGGGERCRCLSSILSQQAVRRLGDLRGKDVARFQLVHPLQGFPGGKHPLHPAILHQQYMAAVVRNVFGVMLDHNDGFALLFVQLPQHLIDTIRMERVKLRDGLVQDQNIRAQRYSARQSQKMGLAAGKLPNILIFTAPQSTLLQRLPSPLQIVGKRIVQASIGGVIQHGGPDDLIFKVLIDIPDFLSQRTYLALQSVQPLYTDLPAKIPRNKMGDQAIEDLA